MLKITDTTLDGRALPVLRLEGQIVGDWVGELRHACADRRTRAAVPLMLDLAEVTFIDHAGLAFLDEIYPDVTLVNCSLFAAEQLKPVIERHRRRA